MVTFLRLPIITYLLDLLALGLRAPQWSPGRGLLPRFDFSQVDLFILAAVGRG